MIRAIIFSLSSIAVSAAAVTPSLEDGWAEIESQGIRSFETYLTTSEADRARRSFTFDNRLLSSLQNIAYKLHIQAGNAPILYTKGVDAMTSYAQETMAPALAGLSGLPLVRELLRRFRDIKLYAKLLRHILLHVDHQWVPKHKKLTLAVRAVQIFKSELYDICRPALVEAVLAFIEEDRRDHLIDAPESVQELIKILPEIGAEYVVDFEGALLEASEAFYARKAEEWLGSDSTVEYVGRAESAFDAENARVVRYLPSATWPKLRGVLITQLLQTRQADILALSPSSMQLLTRDDFTLFDRLQALLSTFEGGLLPLGAVLRQYVTESVTALMQARRQVDPKESKSKADGVLIEAVVAFYQKFAQKHESGAFVVPFMNTRIFGDALKLGFTSALNGDETEFANSLANYCDSVLKTRQDERELFKKLDDSVGALLPFVIAKDVFIFASHTLMASRLLNGSSADADGEKHLISIVQGICDFGDSAKLNALLADFTVAGTELQRQFQENCLQPLIDADDRLGSLASATTVTCLGRFTWPSVPDIKLIGKHPALAALEKRILSFYQQQHSGRKLGLIPSASSVTLTAKFGERNYDFEMSYAQATLLLNLVAGSKSVEELAEITGMSVDHVKRYAHPLYSAKKSILLNQEGRLAIKQDFSSSLRQTKYPRPTDADLKKVKVGVDTGDVDTKRTAVYESSIVRIMKARKTLSHRDLAAEVMQQVDSLGRFKASNAAIKKAIESLLNRDYLERDPEDATSYRYVA